MELAEEVNADPEGSKDRLSHVFEIETRALTYWKSSGLYSRDLHRRELFHPSVSETFILF